jgi:hypothetical protein
MRPRLIYQIRQRIEVVIEIKLMKLEVSVSTRPPVWQECAMGLGRPAATNYRYIKAQQVIDKARTGERIAADYENLFSVRQARYSW